ncbi:AI-2E family transporter [Nocardioides sp. SYSU DS0663]|uniref:AI-2E family transporter n=1 Tax=Nocardioides sp. SYSU DS0663 TaxID=3416445 RepID=UPI003F4B8A89
MSGPPEDGAPARWRDLVPTWLVRTVLWCVALLLVARTIDLVVDWLVTILTVTAAIVAALLLTALLRPVHGRLAKVMPNALSSLLTIILTLAAITGVMYAVVSRALNQIGDLRQAVQQGIADVRTKLESTGLPLPADLQPTQAELVQRVNQLLPPPTALATMATEILAGFVLAVFTWFFLQKDGSRMWAWFTSWVPEHRLATVDRTGHGVWHVLERYMQGMTMVAFIDAVGIGGTMVVLGVPLAASLTCIVFIGAYVPVVGAFVSGGLAVLVTLVLLGPTEALILLVAVFVVQQVEGNLLQPLVMGKVLNLHPVPIVVAVSVGALIGGILGAVVAVPVLAVAYRIATELHGERHPPAESVAPD